MIHRRQEGEKTGLPASSLRSSLPRRPRGAVDREMFTRQEKKEVDDIDGVLCATEEEGGRGRGEGRGGGPTAMFSRRVGSLLHFLYIDR